MIAFASKHQPIMRFILLIVFAAYHASLAGAVTAVAASTIPKNGDSLSATAAKAAADSKKHAKVPLEAHIMSKCPDAEDCIRDLVIPAMQNVSDKVNFTLSFIGKITNHDDGVSCKHGQTECLGDMLELCAANLYPTPRIYLGFTMCLFNDYTHIPGDTLVKGCALEYGIDFEKLNDCASKDHGENGMALLRESVKRSSKAGVEKSCTVRLNNTVWCVRDGGEWTGCDDGSKPKDLIKAVKKLYKESGEDSEKSDDVENARKEL